MFNLLFLDSYKIEMKIFRSLIVVIALLVIFFEEKSTERNVYLMVVAIVVFMFFMMRLSAKTPSKNQNKENENV